MQGYPLIILIIIGFSYCQNVNDIDVKDGLKKIGLDQELPDLEERLNNTKLPKIEDVENVLKKKCEQQGAGSAVDLIKEQQESTKLCVENFINFTVVQEELDKAKLTGSMDEVFAKYCALWPEISSCFDNATDIARQCMDNKEEKAFNKTLDIIIELKEFMCFKDGDRLAMFVAEGGLECLQERKTGVEICLNETFGARIPDSDEFTLTNMPSFLYSSQDCHDFDAVRVCINGELEQCEDSTPANIVDAFLKFLKKQMPCKVDELPETSKKVGAVQRQQDSSSTFVAVNTFLVIALVVVNLAGPLNE